MTLKPKMTYLRQQETSLVSLILLRLFWFCGCVEGILLPTASSSPIGHFVLQNAGSAPPKVTSVEFEPDESLSLSAAQAVLSCQTKICQACANACARQ